MLRALSRIACASVLCAGLAACFQPVYAPNLGVGTNVAATLASIEVQQMEGHLGFQMKSELDFLLTNGTPPANPVYRLTAAPKGGVASVIVDVAGSRPLILTYTATANYSLVEIKSGKLVTSGTAQATASFDRNTQRFANVRAQRDAEIRTAKQLAEQIRARIIPVITAPGS